MRSRRSVGAKKKRGTSAKGRWGRALTEMSPGIGRGVALSQQSGGELLSELERESEQ